VNLRRSGGKTLTCYLAGAATAAVCIALGVAPARGQIFDDITDRKGGDGQEGAYRATSAVDLAEKLHAGFQGTIVVPAGVDWRMVTPCGAYDELGRCYATPMMEIPLKSGVTLVGERDRLGRRPVLRAAASRLSYSLFNADASSLVRIEGLHLIGPKKFENRFKKDDPKTEAISVDEDAQAIRALGTAVRRRGHRVVIRDNEIERFSSAVGVSGTIQADTPADYDLQSRVHLTRRDADLVRVDGNYLHDNLASGAGYGVVVGGGAYAHIEGNVFEYQNHHIAASGRAYSGFIARFNYSLRGTYMNHAGKPPHTFDVHGRGGATDGKYSGGPAGTYFEVALNTFLYDGDKAFKVRGTPTNGAYFSGNVLAHGSIGGAVEYEGDRGYQSDNRTGTDYSNEIAAGDFDADGRTDVLVSNGTAWFWSRGGVRPWEYLRPSNKRISELGFADITGDRATDVLYRSDDGQVSYFNGVVGALVPLTTTRVPMAKLRFGDFDGDGRTDIFYTYEGRWRIWSPVTRLWRDGASSSKSVEALRFGEFDNVRGTDVVGINSDGWAYSSGATGPWTRMNGRLTKTFDNAVVADVDGGPGSDIVIGGKGNSWRYSRDGRSALMPLRAGSGNVEQRRVGRFDGGTRDGIVSFGYPAKRNRLGLWRSLEGGKGAVSFSGQNMR
jgi:hypothetical protein